MPSGGHNTRRRGASSDSDDDDDDDDELGPGGDFLGTPLEPIEASSDEEGGKGARQSSAKRAKQEQLRAQSSLPVHQQRVLDERGRPLRFHGAFTGGFSAGHFNTVGTVEGFTPVEFRSSRRDRAQREQEQRRQRPEDFMDAEDLGEFGIAPREVRARPDYDGAELRRMMADASGAAAATSDRLVELLLPSETGLGDRLLRRLGWRPDHAVDCSDDDNNEDNQPTATVDLLAKLRLKPGRDTRGLGYAGLDAGLALTSSSGKSGVSGGRPVVGGFRGQAFGVGALESEDADIYNSDPMANYDFSIGTDAEEAALAGRRDNFGWTAPARSGHKSVDKDEAVLDGFVLRHGGALRRRTYPPPELPPGFVPVHKTAPPLDALDIALNQLRAQAEEIAESALPVPPKSQPLNNSIRTSRWDASPSAPPVCATSSSTPFSSSTPSAALTSARWHQQFGHDPSKQARFHSYLRWRGAGAGTGIDPYEKAAAGADGLTDWERSLEREEFSKAASEADQRVPASLHSRFKPAGTPDMEQETKSPAEALVTVTTGSSNSAKPNRRVSEWRPHAMVCRRLNVPNPFPDSSATLGSTSSGKRDNRPSVFDLLAVDHSATSGADASSASSRTSALFACLFEENHAAQFANPATGTSAVLSETPAPAPSGGLTVPPAEVSASASKTSVAIAVATATAPAALVESSRPSMNLFRSIFSDDEDDDANAENSNSKEEAAMSDSEKSELAKESKKQDRSLPIAKPLEQEEPSATAAQSTSRMLAASSLFAHLFEDQAPLQPPPPPQPPSRTDTRPQIAPRKSFTPPSPPPKPPLPPPTSQQVSSSAAEREIRRLEKKLKKELKKAKKTKKKKRKASESDSGSENDSYEFLPVTKDSR